MYLVKISQLIFSINLLNLEYVGHIDELFMLNGGDWE